MSRRLKQLWVALGALLGVAALLLVALYAALQTPSGQGWAAARLSALLSSPAQSISIERIGLTLPGPLRIDGLTLGDRGGGWLRVDRIDVAPSWHRILAGEIALDRVVIGTADLLRAPANQEASQEKSSSGGSSAALWIDALEIARLALDPSLLGETVTLAISGRDIAGSADRLQATLAAHRLDGPGALDLAARYDPSADALTATARLDEPSGLLAERLLGRRLPLSVTLDGTGPLSHWQGKLAAAAGADGHLDLDLSVAAAGDGRSVALAGTIAAAALLPEPYGSMLGAATKLEARLRQAPDRLVLEGASLDAAAGKIVAAGDYRLADAALAATADLTLPDLARFAPLLRAPPSGAATLHLALAGTAARPAVTATLAVDNLAYGGDRVARLAAELSATPDRDIGDVATRIAIDGKGAVADLDLADAALPEPLRKAIDWQLSARLARSGDEVALERFTVTDTGIALAVAARLADGIVEGTAKLGVDDLAVALGAGHTGRAALALDFRGDPAAATGTVRWSGNVEDVKSGIAQLDAVLGQHATLTGLATRRDDGTVALEGLELAGAAASLEGEGEASGDLNRIAARLRGSMPQLSALAPVAGSATLRADIGGGWPKLTGTASVEARGLSYSGTRFDALNARVSGVDLERRRLHLDLDFRAPQNLSGAGKADVALLENGRIRLSDVALDAAKARLTGTIEIAPEPLALSGKLAASVPDLAPFGGLAGVPLAGAVDATIDLAAANGQGANGQGTKGQSATLDLKATRLAVAANRVASARATARLDDLFGAPQGRGELGLTNVTAGTVRLDNAALKFSSARAGRFAFTTDLKGEAQAPLTLTAGGEADEANGGVALTLAKLEGRFAGERLALGRPLRLAVSRDRYSFSDLALTLGSGRIEGEGSLAGERLSLRLLGRALPVELGAKLAGSKEVSGRLGLDVALDGTLAAPRGTATITGDPLRFAAVSHPDLPPLSLSAHADWQGGRVTLRGRVDATKGAALGFSGAAPLRLQRPVAIELPPDGAIALKLEGEGRLEQLADLLPLGEDRVAGRYRLDISVGGTVAAPAAGGSFALAEGRYENLASGALLTNVALSVAGDGQRFALRRLSASDGDKGKLEGSGNVLLGEGGPPRLDLRTRFDNFRLLRRDDARATGSGELKLDGTLAEPRLAGELTLSRAEIDIPDRLPASIPELSIERIDSRTGAVMSRPPSDAEKTPPLVVALALAVNAPGQIFIRGRGLDSEWRGKLQIGGTSAAPTIAGTLETVRGTYSLLGTDFQITRGALGFGGGTSTDPSIDLLAQATASSVTAQVQLGGRASAPSLSLSSSPPLPQDEVLSRLLFGQSLSQITPLQGLQIAQAANSLAGGGGPDVLAKLRRGLGLDRLSVGQTTDATGRATGTTNQSSGSSGVGNSSLSAGKYVAPGVYLGVEQGFGAGQSAVRVETEITPHINADAKAGAQGDNSVGLNFRMDY